MFYAAPALAAVAGAAAVDPQVVAWGLAAAAGATAASSLAAGYAVAKVGTAAIGALAEKPELMARLLTNGFSLRTPALEPSGRST